MTIFFIIVIILQLVILAVLLLRGRNQLNIRAEFDRIEEKIRTEFAANRKENLEVAASTRLELSGGVNLLNEGLTRQLNAFSERLEVLRHSLSQSAQTQRMELADNLKTSSESNRAAITELTKQQKELLESMRDTFDKKFESIRLTVSENLDKVRQENSSKLEEMRKTVDEKLHDTLEKRLGESFKQVSERLELVHKGLGEMQQLATGVGDLKKVLTNVKVRGVWGEFQLAALLHQILTEDQYASNYAPRQRSQERVEFAIRLPGPDETGESVYLPIDAKFPREDYERLIEASEKGDAAGVEAAAKMLENRLTQEARDIRDKYIVPPQTTDFAILYLPTEGLYAEALRRPGLAEKLQQQYRVVIAGPTTLAALLNSLQMGFRTLAIQKRSSEVWKVLAAVKKKFAQFGEVFERAQKKIQEADRALDDARNKTTTIKKTLNAVESMTDAEADRVLAMSQPPELNANSNQEESDEIKQE